MESLRNWQKSDYLTDKPYKELYEQRGDTFYHRVLLERMAEEALAAGFKTFKRMYGEYVKRQKDTAVAYGENFTQFDGQQFEFACGKWRCDDFGVSTHDDRCEVVACVHPIMPTCRLVNVDTGLEKVELSYKKGGRWRKLITDKKTVASANKIIDLSDNGIAVTSENAKSLVRYIHDIENWNYDAIPQKPSVGRLGYIGDSGFAPYVDGLVFDGDANYATIFESVRSKGTFEAWKAAISAARNDSVVAKIVIAASFASILVNPLGCLPFFVHLWSSESGTGKTVALMAAASVWADPEVGRYIQTFNSTSVGHERLAAFLNSLPIIVDELQLAKDSHGRLNFDVYKLAEGVGRTRGNRAGGIDKTPTWSNCIITSGETPITENSSGAGAQNRVLEIECTMGDMVIKNGRETSSALRGNYGHAGRMFVEMLKDEQTTKDAHDIGVHG